MHPFNAASLSWSGGGDLIVLGTSDGIEVRCNHPNQLLQDAHGLAKDIDTACVGDHAHAQ